MQSIINVIEAGTWPDDRPFLAMKLVAGRSLDKLIAATPTLVERLALLPHVLAAVDALAYAHSERVIHRDLKPDNILCGDYGETVVIDWGLAKDLRVTDDIAAVRIDAGEGETVAGSVMGTAAYMPPEQARGETLDERCDVFSLGAILLHLLSGTRPWGRVSSLEVLANLNDNTLPAFDGLAGAPPDLVAIVEKAMAASPDRRYATAEELAVDLRKYHTGQLVGAHRYTTGQLVRRWIARNRRTVIVGSALLAALAITAVVAVLQIIRERDTTELRRQEAVSGRTAAEKVVSFMVFELHTRLEGAGRLDLLTGIGRTVRNYHVEVSKLQHGPVDTDTTRQRVQAFAILGEVEYKKGNLDAARSMYVTCTDVAKNALAADPDSPSALHAQALCMRGTCKIEDSGKCAEEYVAAAEKLPPDTGDRVGQQRTLATAYLDLALELSQNGKLDEAAAAYAKTKDMLVPLAASNTANFRLQLDLADMYRWLGRFEQSRRRFDEAVALLEKGLAVARPLLEKDPRHVIANQLVGFLYEALGDTHRRRGDYAAASKPLRAALDLHRARARLEPENLRVQSHMTSAMSTLAQIEAKLGHMTEALALQEEAQIVIERVLERAPKDREWRTQVAAIHDAIGTTRLLMKRYDAACDGYGRALAIYEDLELDDPENAEVQYLAAGSSKKLSRCERLGNHLAEARRHADRALARVEKLRAAKPDYEPVLEMLSNIRLERSDLFATAKDARGALAEAEHAIETSEAMLAKRPSATARSKLAILRFEVAKMAKKNKARMRQHLARSIELYEQLEKDSPLDAKAKQRVADARKLLGQPPARGDKR